jgi:NitT/TauT family transport system substrate-binding protein
VQRLDGPHRTVPWRIARAGIFPGAQGLLPTTLRRQLAPNINGAAIGAACIPPLSSQACRPTRENVMSRFPACTATRRLALAIGAAALVAGFPGAASAQTKLRMVLNWKYQGPQGFFFVAEDKGYFKAEGLDVVIDQGDGSATPIPKVASGTYDVGFGDVNALIDFASKRPEEAPIAVYVMFNRPPFTVAVKADSPIKTPKDFEGRTLGGAANDGALKLFPALCKSAKIDCGKVKITNMQPNLREQMLMQGQVDGVFGYVNTIRFSAKLIGIDPDKQLRFINYGDYGMDLYSNGIIVSKKLVKEKPEVVRGFVRALNKAVIDSLKDPKMAVNAVLKREPLIKFDVELERMEATLTDEMNHPEIARIGLGNVDEARLKRSIDILVEASALPRTPKVEEIFTPAFLPPAADLPKTLF